MAFYGIISRNVKPIALGVMFHSTPIALFFPHDSEYAFWVNCFSVALLAVFLRFLLAFRPALERSVWSVAVLRAALKVGRVSEEDGGHVNVRLRGTDDAAAKQKLSVRTLPWALKPFGTAPLSHVNESVQIYVLRARRAMYEVLIAFVGYLLLVAVMTLNIGYFASALVGVFIGTLIMGGGTIGEGIPPAVDFQPYNSRR
ncbi:hypothetical protein ACRALDRAFT_1072935 [Sodiomyces alcalophilus JCM 7366]|uniref:uncharacterized protein n=1 Tax=Sodiomyces alcalophilus JCM 7366 TaxID=591952 RepID=UPI0039B567F0